MDSFGSQQRFLFAASYEEMRGGADRRAPVVCPKPRPLGRLARPDLLRPVSCKACNRQAETCDSKVSAELLDIFLNKGGEANQVASSPPFFCGGSPPRRTSNPLVHDARFRQEGEAIASLMPVAVPLSSTSPMNPVVAASSRKGYTLPTKLGFKPAAMRIEGFDCLNRDRRGCGIAANA